MSDRNPSGILEVVLGDGYLKPAELLKLEAGQILRAGITATEPLTILFNGMPISSGSLCIIDSHVCVKITALYSRTRYSQFSYNGIGIRYSFKITLGSCKMKLRKIMECGIGTFISLDALYNPHENAWLHISGVEAARGVIVFSEETLQMGIKLTKLTRKLELPYLPEGKSLMTEDVWLYFDYSRPNLLSMDQISNLWNTHQKLVDYTELPPPGLNVIAVDQIHTREWTKTHSTRENSFYKVYTKETDAGEEMDEQAAAVLVTPKKQSHPLDEESRMFCEYQYHARRNGIGMFFIFMKGIKLTKDDETTLLEALNQIWKNKIICTGIEHIPSKKSSMPNQIKESMLLIIYTENGTEFLYPDSLLEPLLPIL